MNVASDRSSSSNAATQTPYSWLIWPSGSLGYNQKRSLAARCYWEPGLSSLTHTQLDCRKMLLEGQQGGGSCVKLWPLKAGKKPDLPLLLKTCVYSLTNPPVNAGMDHSFGPGKNYHMTIRESSLSTQRVTALTEVTQKNRRRSSPPANALSHSRQQVLSLMAVTWGQRRQCSCHHEM